MLRPFAVLTGLVLAAATPPAHAQMVRAQDPESVLRGLKSAGLTGEIKKDGEGDPMISSKVDGTSFQVFFYNCSSNRNCATIQFHTGYDLETPVTWEKINEWNRTQRFGRAHLDKESDPILQMDIDLDDGGMSTALFTDNIEFWTTIVTKFEKHIGY